MCRSVGGRCVGPASAADAGMRLCGTMSMGRVPRGVPCVICRGCEVINEGSGGRGDRGFPSAAECSMPHSIAFGPSAAYVAGCAADCGWRDGWWSVWRRGHGGGGTGDVVSYFVHWSRAARPKLLQHRGCHKAAVMTVFTANRPPLHTLAQAVEDARGVWRRRCAARLARAASGMSHAPACSCKIMQR